VGDCPLFPDDYQPRDPKASPLYRLLDVHFDEYKTVYEERFQKDYGYWRPVVDEVVTQAVDAGAILVKNPQKVFWGGYSGYFKDLDGHLWEVAHNPLFWVGPEDDNA